MASTGKKAADAGPKTMVLTFAFEKDTKNTLRFAEQDVPDGERPAIGTLYITKAALAEAGLGDFRTIHVTVEAGN